MLSKSILVLAFRLIMTSAGPVQDAEEQTIQLLPANISENEFAGGFNPSNALKIECDGQKYGFNPNVPDCQQARTFYKRSAQLFTYGERHSGHGTDVFPLPYRLMGGQLPQSLICRACILRPISLRFQQMKDCAISSRS